MTDIVSRMLVVGSGGREHALAWKLSLSPLVTVIFLLPGNHGTANLKKCHNVPGSWNHRDDVVAFALKAKVTLFIPTMEQWLVDGIVDDFMSGNQWVLSSARHFCLRMKPVSHALVPQRMQRN